MKAHTHRVAPFMPEGQAFWEGECVQRDCPVEPLRQEVARLRRLVQLLKTKWPAGSGLRISADVALRSGGSSRARSER